jgi:hypothetical protein
VFRIAKWSPMLCLIIALCGPAAHAGTYAAASCNQNDVNAVINGPTHTAVDGDMINIPAGSCTWTSGITVPSGIGITIIGNGTPNSGAGTENSSCGQTVITDKLSSGNLFATSPKYGNSTTRISCMEIITYTPYSGYDSPIFVVGTCTSSGCPNLRIDNLTIPTGGACSISDATFAVVSNMFGVADHNTVGDSSTTCNGVDLINIAHGNWMGVGSWGDNSWASADTFGTAQAFYLENNTFNYAFGTDADRYGPSYGGGRFVCRFNTFENVTGASACTNHGTDTIGRTRGGRQMEFYNNNIASCQSAACNTVAGSRSGATMIFGNSFTGQFTNTYFMVDTKRRWDADMPWGACDGSSPWDTNDGTTYYSGTIGSIGGSEDAGFWTITDGSPGWSTNKWDVNGDPYSFHDVTKGWGYEIASNTSNVLTTATNGGGSGNGAPGAGDSYQILRASVCMDQGGRGAGLRVEGGDGTASTDGFLTARLVSTGSPGAVNDTLDPIYEFADSGSPAHNEVAGDSQGFIANRDYYAQSIGQTAQTSPTSPFNGTSGTGYGTLANRPTTCIPRVGYWATDQGSWNQSGSGGQGQLYICTATNAWTLSYTPYTYPHPLTAGGTSGQPPNPPTKLSATVQ